MRTAKGFWVRALGTCAAGAAVGCTTVPSLEQGHRYGDLEAGSVECEKEAGELDDLLGPYMRPEMMAIGDSIYNGVRALRVNWWLAEWSAPAMAAMALELIETDEASRMRTGKREFYVPRYPGHPAYHGGEGVSTLRRYDLNIGFNLEAVSLRQIDLYVGEQARTLKALADRSFARTERRPVNDNLAFFGADATDLLTLTDARAEEIMSRPPEGQPEERSIAELRDAAAAADQIGITNLAGSVGWIGDAAFYTNAGFVLNPLGLDCIARMSAIDQVAAREPRRLLVNIGANHGIFRVAFDGYDIDMEVAKLEEPGGVVRRTIRRELGQLFLDRMRTIVDRLAVIEGIEHVYINTLPRPSFAANLMPVDHVAWPRRAPGLHKYYRGYRPAFTFGGSRQLSAKHVEEADDLVRRVNEELRKLLDEANERLGRDDDRKFILVEIEQLLDMHDAKHTGDTNDGLPVHTSGLWPFCSTHLTNLPLAPAPGGWCGIEFSRGGIFSMDNMHLSTPAYGAIAVLVANTVAKTEGINLSKTGAETIKPEELFASEALENDIFLRNATTFGGNLVALDLLGDVAAFARRAFLREPQAGAVPASPASPPSTPND
jgi:hypothetical protein